MLARTVYCFLLFASMAGSTQLRAGSYVDVKLSYKYLGEEKQPQHKQKYCLEVTPSDELSKHTMDKLQKACALAAGLKHYQVVGKETDCHKITVALDVEDDEHRYTKTAHFSFYDGSDTQPTLNVLASFHSDNAEFNTYSMIAVCRATFDEIPSQSKTFHVDASTEPEDNEYIRGVPGSRSDTEEAPVNGNGAYVMSELMMNGFGASIGYYFNEQAAAEVGYLSLSRSLNQDAGSIDKYYIKSRIFYSRKSYVGLGIAWQTVYFDDRYELTRNDSIESLPSNAGPTPREFKGSLTTIGGEASLGWLLIGKSHSQGFNFGLDLLGVYHAWQVKRDHLTIASTDPDIRSRIVSKVKDQDTFYVLRLLLGYTF